MTSSQSAELSERAKRVLPSGASRLSTAQEPFPIFAKSGRGCRITDVDGVERIDFVNNHSTLVLGHANPAIIAVVSEQLKKGTCFAMPTASEVILAEKLCARVQSVEQTRFMNSASEAVAVALRAARAFTGRQKVAKVEGGYHGQIDFLEVSLGSNPNNWGDPVPNSTSYSSGTSEATLEQVIVFRYNNIENSMRSLYPYRKELAAVFVELMPIRCGMVMADKEFLEELVSFCKSNGILVVYDETMTFRLALGGAQSWYKDTPDLTVFGKMLGGGLPIGALGGSAEVMSVFDSSSSNFVAHGGALAGNPLSMVAAAKTLELLNGETIDTLNRLGEYARKRMQEIVRNATGGQVTGAGSFFRIHLHSDPVKEYRAVQLASDLARMTRVQAALLDSGYILSGSLSGNLSTIMSKIEIDGLCNSLGEVLCNERPNTEEG